MLIANRSLLAEINAISIPEKKAESKSDAKIIENAAKGIYNLNRVLLALANILILTLISRYYKPWLFDFLYFLV